MDPNQTPNQGAHCIFGLNDKSCWIAFEYIEQTLNTDQIFRLENIGRTWAYIVSLSLSNCIIFSQDDGAQIVLSLSNCHIVKCGISLSICIFSPRIQGGIV